eukprot:501836-Lingulodinium_polyedra.AAC.1
MSSSLMTTARLAASVTYTRSVATSPSCICCCSGKIIDDISSAKHNSTYCPNSSASVVEMLSTSPCSTGTGTSLQVDVMRLSCLHANNTACYGIMSTGVVGISTYIGCSTNGVVFTSS